MPAKAMPLMRRTLNAPRWCVCVCANIFLKEVDALILSDIFLCLSLSLVLGTLGSFSIYALPYFLSTLLVLFLALTSSQHQLPRSNRLRRLLLDRNASRAEIKATTTPVALGSSSAAADSAAAAAAADSSAKKPPASKHPKRQAAYVAALAAQVRCSAPR